MHSSSQKIGAEEISRIDDTTFIKATDLFSQEYYNDQFQIHIYAGIEEQMGSIDKGGLKIFFIFQWSYSLYITNNGFRWKFRSKINSGHVDVNQKATLHKSIEA